MVNYTCASSVLPVQTQKEWSEETLYITRFISAGLESVRLTECNLGSDGPAAAASPGAHHSHHLAPRGAAAAEALRALLAAALRAGRLAELDLGGNGLGDIGAAAARAASSRLSSSLLPHSCVSPCSPVHCSRLRSRSHARACPSSLPNAGGRGAPPAGRRRARGAHRAPQPRGERPHGRGRPRGGGGARGRDAASGAELTGVRNLEI